MLNNQKGLSKILILGIIAVVVLIGAGVGGYFVFVKNSNRLPILTAIQPVEGPIGTKVILTGSNFKQDKTIVSIGTIDIGGLVSSDGHQITFFVPPAGSSSCTPDALCTTDVEYMETGEQKVVIRTTAGLSNSLSFTVTTNSEVTSTWKTYRNEKYGFEVRYPALGIEQKIEDEGRAIYFKDRITASSVMVTGFAITIDENKKELSFTEWFRQNLDAEGIIKDYTKIFDYRLITGGEIYMINQPLPDNYGDVHGPTPDIYFITSDKNLVLTISPSQDYNLDFYGYDTPAKIDKLLSQILSTFRFIK